MVKTKHEIAMETFQEFDPEILETPVMVFMYVAEAGQKVQMSEVAGCIRMSNATCSRHISVLTNTLGLTTSEFDGDRKRWIGLTQQGIRLYSEISRKVQIQMVEALFDGE